MNLYYTTNATYVKKNSEKKQGKMKDGTKRFHQLLMLKDPSIKSSALECDRCILSVERNNVLTLTDELVNRLKQCVHLFIPAIVLKVAYLAE